MDVDSTELILERSRFWIQKVLVPILVCIGVTGNTITVMVLTRRRMRSSTNIYLSALAIADIIYLLFVFLLSAVHYNNIHDRKYELYWRFYGISHWLCDTASSTSIWLTVSFTIERYIAVCHPMKGKYFCTENRAKTVTVIVYIFCLLTTASTTFEYQLNLYNTTTCAECKNDTNLRLDNTSTSNDLFPNSTIYYVPNNMVLTKGNSSTDNHNISTIKVFNDPNLKTALKNILGNCTMKPYHPHIIYVYPHIVNITHERSLPDSTKVETISNMTVVHQYTNENSMEKPLNYINDSDDDVVTGNLTGNSTNVSIKPCCNVTKLFIDVESTILGKNETYTTFISWHSAMTFGIVPLVLIATFNCFLVHAVITSQKQRRTLTNSKSHHNSQENASVSNENRITMMLIAVVVMFLISQTPAASHLIYYSLYPPDPDSKAEKNIHSALGNVCNFLVAVNASCNFMLYSIMSKKFRSTFKQLFFERGKKRQDTIALSSTKSHNSQKFNPYKHGIKRNPSEYHTPRNLETTSLTSIPRTKSLISRPAGQAKSTDLNV